MYKCSHDITQVLGAKSKTQEHVNNTFVIIDKPVTEYFRHPTAVTKPIQISPLSVLLRSWPISDRYRCTVCFSTIEACVLRCYDSFWPLSCGSRIYTGNTKHHYVHRCPGARSAPSHQWPQRCFMSNVAYSHENRLPFLQILSRCYLKQTTPQNVVCFWAITSSMLRVNL